MGKGPTNGGIIANRGFIFQAIIAEIQCLERNDWDAIKVEPETTLDKVDIMLYKDREILSAMQVKSSKNPFERSNVQKWLEKLRADATDAEEICLFLVGDFYQSVCEDFIAEHPNEIKKIPFENLSIICKGTLVEYIRNAGVGSEVRVDDIEFIDDALFAKLFKNSIAKEPISRMAFEDRFQKALPVHIIPKRLTSIPTINHKVGLIGRDDIKKSIREMLEMDDCIVLVNGLGGIGKTAVMQYVCNDLKNNGKYVAWIECGGSLKEDLLLLRTELGIPGSDDANTAYKKIIKEIKANHQLASNLYLFLDNLSYKLNEDEQGILNGLGIHVMATSRFEHEYFENLLLDVLLKDSALDMFYGYFLEKQRDKTRRHVDAALDIINSVQSHTLLMELLAKAAWKKGGTLESFRDELKEKGVYDVFKRKLSTKQYKNKTIEECVMELYKISGLTSEQQHIMKLFTIFTPEKEIYYKIGEWADLDMVAMDELVDLGWLERGGLENGYQIHQIVKDSLQRQVGKVKLEDYGKLLNKAIDTENYLSVTETYEVVRERIVLTENLAECLWTEYVSDSVKYGEWAYQTSVLFTNLANVYRVQGDYGKAQAYNRKALVICERVFGPENTITSMVYNNLALIYEAQGDYGKAQEYHERALAFVDGKFGMELATAASYNNLAVVYRAQGDYEKALEYYKKALSIKERVLGMEHPITAVTYNNLALVYHKMHDFGMALEYHEKARNIRERVLGMKHPDTAETYHNLAGVYETQGDYGKALEYYKKARDIRELVLGTENPDTAETYNNLAVVYKAQGNFGEATKYSVKACTVFERVFGTEHPHTATIYHNFAGVYKEQGNYGKALEYYEKACNIRERVLGMGHPDTANTYESLAKVYHMQGNYEKALDYYERFLTYCQRELGMNHLLTGAVYYNIAAVYKSLGDYRKALKYYEKNLFIVEQSLGTEHPGTVTTYNNMAEVYNAQGDYEKALEYYGKALAVRERVLGTDHPETATTYNNMAGVCADKGDYEKALEYYGKTLAIVERVLGAEHPNTATTYNNMAWVYRKQGDYEKALEYYGKDLAISERVLGTEHPSMAKIYHNMAMLYNEQGDYDKAFKYYGKALAVRERVLGTGHPDTAMTYNNIAWVYRAQGDYEKALDYYKRANAVCITVFGENHPHTKDTQLGVKIMEQLIETGMTEDELIKLLSQE